MGAAHVRFAHAMKPAVGAEGPLGAPWPGRLPGWRISAALWLLLFVAGADPGFAQLSNPLFLPQRTEPVIASAADLASRSAYYAPPAFSKVSSDELEMEADHGFPFEILDRTRVVSFARREGGILAVIEDQVRIKIHTDQPREQLQAGLVTLPVLRQEARERVDRIHGITHHPDGSWAELRPADIRRTQYNDRVDLIEFVLPEIRQGSVLEYRYRIVRTGIERLPDFRFSDRVPVARAALHVIPPPYLRYSEQLRDPEGAVRFSSERIDTANVRRLFSERGPEPLYIASWVARDVPPEELSYESEPAVGSGVWIRFLIGEFGLPRQSLENSWDVVEAQVRRHSDPFAATSDASGLRAWGDSLARAVRGRPADLAGSTAAGRGAGAAIADEPADWRSQVVREAFDLVRTRFRTNHSFDVTPDTLRLDEAVRLPSVNQATMNLALMAVLEGAGLDVRPVYHSGGRFGAMDTLFPSVFQLQGVVLAVDGVSGGGAGGDSDGDSGSDSGDAPGAPLLLDASFEHGRPGMVNPDVSGQAGFRLGRDGGHDWVGLRGAHDRYWSGFDVEGRLTAEGALAGTLRVELKGYAARSASMAVAGGQTPSDYMQSVFLDRYQDVALDGTRFEDLYEKEGTVRMEATFAITGYALDFTDAFDLPPLPVGYLQENPYSAPERRTPLEMLAPERLDVRVSLKLPAGQRAMVEERDDRLGIPGARFALQVESASSRAGELRYRATLDRTGTRFEVDVYPQVREMYVKWLELSSARWRIEK